MPNLITGSNITDIQSDKTKFVAGLNPWSRIERKAIVVPVDLQLGIGLWLNVAFKVKFAIITNSHFRWKWNCENRFHSGFLHISVWCWSQLQRCSGISLLDVVQSCLASRVLSCRDDSRLWMNLSRPRRRCHSSCILGDAGEDAGVSLASWRDVQRHDAEIHAGHNPRSACQWLVVQFPD